MPAGSFFIVFVQNKYYSAQLNKLQAFFSWLKMKKAFCVLVFKAQLERFLIHFSFFFHLFCSS